MRKDEAGTHTINTKVVMLCSSRDDDYDYGTPVTRYIGIPSIRWNVHLDVMDRTVTVFGTAKALSHTKDLHDCVLQNCRFRSKDVVLVPLGLFRFILLPT